MAGADKEHTVEGVDNDPQAVVRSVDPRIKAGADGGNISVSVPEVYRGPLTRSLANKD